MNRNELRDYCLSMTAAVEDFPFGTDVAVFKVKGKMFALTDIEMFESINLKCDPEEAIELRERYAAVQPGYHMNKAHWNTIIMDNSISDKLIEKWVNDSYELVRSKLPKSQR